MTNTFPFAIIEKPTDSRKSAKGACEKLKGEKGKKRKQELLQIAYQLFIRKGYEETSIDDIIAEAHIAKGTYYYHFPSKEATLEAVIDWMIDCEVRKAKEILDSPLSVPQKLVGVITSLRPEQHESSITDTLNRKENLIMHEKVGRKMIGEAVPLLTQIVSEGIAQGVFACDLIKERVRMILIMSHHLFDDGSFTPEDVTVFLDTVEKMLGAQPGTLGYIRKLIH